MSDNPPDSPLSTTGNIIGILTFALAVFSFCAAFYAITHDAPREIEAYRESLKERKDHIKEIKRYFDELDIVADSVLEQSPIDPLIHNSLRSLENRRQVMEKELSNIRGRLQWWYRRQDMATSMARIETQLQHLGAIQLTFLLL
ncbi:hypothetical protein DL98DRAFT_599520 [Cadophora sp. DSE1049]|nr:hypothetical protein DL98DRAFT_599520 [Cadophora sp. DSE1049]